MTKIQLLKRGILATAALLFVSATSFAQTENSLAFDGSNDKVTATGASSYIASSNMSISCWVYPTNTSPNYPNFDGVVGFRNDVSADFYLLHLSTNTFEARLRNSSGTDYTASVPGIQINTWQHVVMTYNGSSLKVFVNGTQAVSISASGNISSNTETFHIGGLPFQSNPFMFGGKLDEVALWSKALSSSEISCMYSNGHDNSDPNLQLFYKCDQGVANGSNTGITSLIDSKGHKNGSLTGFSLSGSSSNFTNGISIAKQLSGTICKGDSFLFAGNYYDKPGSYYSVISSSGNCDSIIQLTLTLDSVDTSVQWINNEELHANQNGATYQWIDCDTKQPIQGQTRQNFRPTAGGNYAVVISKNGCTDTSTCFSTDIGLNENLVSRTSIYPNPSRGNFTLDQGSHSSSGELIVYNTTGSKVVGIHIDGQPQTKLDLDLPAGTYSLVFTDSDGNTSHFSLVIKP